MRRTIGNISIRVRITIQGICLVAKWCVPVATVAVKLDDRCWRSGDGSDD